MLRVRLLSCATSEPAAVVLAMEPVEFVLAVQYEVPTPPPPPLQPEPPITIE